MRLDGLIKPLIESDGFKEVIENLKTDKAPVGIYGVEDSAKSYIVGSLFNRLDKSILILTHSDIEARNIYEDLYLYTPMVHYMPVREAVFYNVEAISGDLRWERLKVLRSLLNKEKKIIVASVDVLSSVCTPVELFKDYIFKISVGNRIDLKGFATKLIQCGYERVAQVETKGQFSIRGGLLDIYPPTVDLPYRIEFFDDEVDSIRTFNTESQRSIDKTFNIEIFPAKEIILSEENIKYGIESISKDLECSLANFKKKKLLEEAENIKKIVSENLESLKEKWSFGTMDSYLPYFYEKTSTFFDYLRDFLIIMDDSQRCGGKLESTETQFMYNYEAFLSRGNILPKQGELLLPMDQVTETLVSKELITLNSMAKATKYFKPRSIVNFNEISITNYQGQLELLVKDIQDKKALGYKVLIFSGTKSRGERLVETLDSNGVTAVYKDSINTLEPGEIVITQGNQLSSFEYPDLKLFVISDKGIFGESKRRVKKKKPQKGTAKIKSFNELKLGDYVVHVNNGIGIYKGIKQLEVQNHKKDFLQIAYADNGTLYVPVDQLDMVHKFIGAEGKTPKVNKLSSLEWSKAKRKVKKSIEDIADDLVKLYANRSILRGHPFSKDTVWQKQFEDEFPYEETPDQLTAIEEIKLSMENAKPMDRLLCGDVGYGKTEVAMRAAFKAVMDGKQVAFLVPTTILAKQHYNTLKSRFESFPVKVDMLSRFRTTAQQKATLEDLKAGNIDIIVGTHKLLQKSVKFKELGLLIVDEEQRFGVSHKEKIKNLKQNIDVLTLSATPIPRTLHMSLTGVREISVIETPPEQRYPIQTYVVEFDEQLIRDAILRELNREGQVFFLYNRVETITEMASYLSGLVPEAKIAIAHGQMTESELENIMLDFIDRKYNVLLCTTIIETGIDIPNANTMIISDADRMGLSQLYQLRGRVGRSNRIAYAYFTYMKDKVLTEVAEKRLKAIKDFTELGSGFKIAMRDLEIRGAGNMMGSSQHGHMSTIGYDLYCRMLEESINKIKGEDENEPVESTIEIKIDAYIPDTYIKDEIQKIQVYKRIAAIDSYDDMMDIYDEMEDRFAEMPLPVVNLINIAYVKSLARELGIYEVKEVKDEIQIKFIHRDRLSKAIINRVLSTYNKELMIKMGEVPTLVYKVRTPKKEDIMNRLKEIFEDFKTVVTSE
ncbi:transcription-repair coupling factor [Clostridium collagenovorans DSM 3089]|uniref:Transcription-repair-coupling factor n=1 Tax=Clostridium collagenovorans DSM 3089 TaxID=1121306 RepID=A0A1M5Y7W9_9CLOT|nr:transcription-repair coupling factor [Clostridium collagenovorans]SHI08157.1 transcription-repair coupling factor [Clostridium collagenovorans DSM 3089]